MVEKYDEKTEQPNERHEPVPGFESEEQFLITGVLGLSDAVFYELDNGYPVKSAETKVAQKYLAEEEERKEERKRHLTLVPPHVGKTAVGSDAREPVQIYA